MDTKDGSLNYTFQSAMPHTFVLGRHGKNSNLLYSDCSYKQGKNKHHLLPLACPKLTPVSVGIKSGTCLTDLLRSGTAASAPPFLHTWFSKHSTPQSCSSPCTFLHPPKSLKPYPITEHTPLSYISIFPLSLGCPPKNRSKMNCKTHPCNA